MIVATAGHVDHGKTSLVKALTGVDTDRLPEEKKRGMTIDLGFAYVESIGFVDVPGHERFIRNMLCGVAGIDFALLVVAADDGPMPQTREHLAILDLLGVSRCAVALTKIDRVPRERAQAVASEMATLLAPTALAGAPVFPVCTSDGTGISELQAHLLHVASKIEARKANGNFRLSVDRCFTLAGAGLVVTGAAMSGEISVGDEVRSALTGARARVRSIHAQNAPAGKGLAGQRLALNLAGWEAKAPVARGDWIVAGAVPPPVRRFDARLKVVERESLAHWTPVHMHLGAADVPGRVARLDETGLVQLVLDRPVGAVHGDRFIVRDQSARRTLGGGRVIDVFPPLRGRAKPARLAWLGAMELDNDAAALDALLALSPNGVDLAQYAVNRNLPAQKGRRFSGAHWSALREHALKTLAAWHARAPDTFGPAEDRILDAIRLPREVVLSLADELIREGKIVREGPNVRLPGHRAELSQPDAALWQQLEPRLEGLRPPSIAELAAVAGMEARKIESALSRAARQGLVVRVSKTRFFRPAPLKDLERMAAEVARGGAPLTAAAFRDRSGIGRNLAIEVLEYFDRIRFTRRVGDARVLMGESHGREPHPGGAHGLQIR